MKKPVASEEVLAGLDAALSRMEADDLTDLTEKELSQMRAADTWLRDMYKYLENRSKP